MKLDQALGIHAQLLSLRARRAEILAANLANADTPGYRAKDMDMEFHSLLARTQQQSATRQNAIQAVRLVATHPRHFTPGAEGPAVELVERPVIQPALDGNTVDAQREHAEFMKNAVRYEASLTFLSGRIRTLLTAIRGQ